MRRTALICFLSLVSATVSLWSQTSSTAAVPIALRIPSSISLSLYSTPVSISVQNGLQHGFTVPLSVTWNLNPQEVPGFGIVAYFKDPEAALADASTATAVSPQQVLARWGQRGFQPFNAADSSVALFHMTTVADSRRGSESHLLELQLADGAIATVPDGSYQGVLYLEVRNY